MSATTAGTLLGGRVKYRQPATGYRTGIEPVLLAASVPACEGDRVVEAGTGAGAGLLCLAARVHGIAGLGLEIDQDMADLAAVNLAENTFFQSTAIRQDVTGWTPQALYDHAFANPPWHEARSTPSPLPARQRAKQGRTGLIAAWSAALAAALKPRGTLSLILPAAALDEGIEALTGGDCGGVTLIPLWPRTGVAAKLVILQGVKGGKGACRVLPGLALHQAGPTYTEAADAILRDGAALDRAD